MCSGVLCVKWCLEKGRKEEKMAAEKRVERAGAAPLSPRSTKKCNKFLVVL